MMHQWAILSSLGQSPAMRSIAKGVAIALLFQIVSVLPTIAQTNSVSGDVDWKNSSSDIGDREIDPLPEDSTSQVDSTLKEDSLDQSPVWQRWQDNPPNVLDEIRNNPALPPRVRLGVASTREWLVGIAAITVSDRAVVTGHYRAAFDAQSAEDY
ncbi:MAG: hypothetical protein AB4050_01435, partial [Synechococcus sp.]